MSKSTRYAVHCDKMTTAERLASEQKSGVIVYDTEDELFYKYNGVGWGAINDPNEIGTGWASYNDDQYTSGSPLVITAGSTVQLTNNAASSIKTHLPNGITDFWNSSTNVITPENSGDAYMLRVSFTAFTDNNNGLAESQLDIGGSQGIIDRRLINFPRGTGLGNARNISYTSLIFSLDTFLANGGTLQIEGITGTTSIYDISILIARIHKAG
jgi:hypothetical protein